VMSRYLGLAQAIYAPPAFIPSGMHWGITSQFPQTIGCLSLPSGNFQRFVMKITDCLPTIFVTTLGSLFVIENTVTSVCKKVTKGKDSTEQEREQQDA